VTDEKAGSDRELGGSPITPCRWWPISSMAKNPTPIPHRSRYNRTLISASTLQYYLEPISSGVGDMIVNRWRLSTNEWKSSASSDIIGFDRWYGGTKSLNHVHDVHDMSLMCHVYIPEFYSRLGLPIIQGAHVCLCLQPYAL
jgi:hypothetical protein